MGNVSRKLDGAGRSRQLRTLILVLALAVAALVAIDPRGPVKEHAGRVESVTRQEHRNGDMSVYLHVRLDDGRMVQVPVREETTVREGAVALVSEATTTILQRSEYRFLGYSD